MSYVVSAPLDEIEHRQCVMPNQVWVTLQWWNIGVARPQRAGGEDLGQMNWDGSIHAEPANWLVV